ncbi:MAG TPA: alanine racemase [Candidatus Dormibacteraeota bacterium]
MVSDRWAEIDLGAVTHNAGYLLSRLPARTKLIAVVKAGGYGLGAEPVARAALDGGAWGLAVATPAEAAQLVRLLDPDRILVMGGMNAAAAGLGCALAVSSLAQVEELARTGHSVPVHLKIDTGMGRFGALPEEAAGIASAIVSSARLRLTGTWTHLASAGEDEAFTRAQMKRFLAAIDGLGVDPGLRHACNSAAALRHPEYALDAVRAGIALYGCDWPELRPVLTLRAALTHVKTVPAGWTVGYGATWQAARESRIGTVAIGYADGVLRSRGNTGWTLVRGTRAPLIGRVSMDAISIDLTDVPDATVGEAVTLIGQDGDERVTAEMVADWSGTISYEVLTALGQRVERRYQE